MANSFVDQILGLEARLRGVEERFYEMGADMRASVQSEVKKRWTISPQAETYFGLYLALCVDTLDRYKQNRVRIFSPLFNQPDVPYTSLDWAYPVSSMGGLDDSGLNWVPPAGSTLCIIFERGNRETPFYLGTTWTRNRGVNGEYLQGYPDMREYWQIHAGHRKGYLVGKDDESQVFPQWNTENYQGFDIDSATDKEDVINAQIKNMTWPHIYGFKTPQKHMLKMDDGDYKCNHRWKRLELQSSCGQHFIMKDDHLHEACQWAHPRCNCERPGSIEDPCHRTWLDGEGKKVGFEAKESPPGYPDSCGKSWYTPQCSDKYFKHENECRPCKGPGTPQNNNITSELFGLSQSGIALTSLSGHYFCMDDQVEEPRGVPDWEKSLRPFDFGCSDKFEGKTWWSSATGHRIEMNDWEDPEQVRGYEGPYKANYIRALTPCGNMLELNDHTVPDCIAGEKRGITLRSSSRHIIKMMDEENAQCAPPRMEPGGGSSPSAPEGRPVNDAKKGFIQIRTGYGLEMIMRDDNSQKETQAQFIRITAPQIDNIERGPHVFRMQEVPEGPGQVLLRVGGDYIIYTYDNMYTIVGDKELNPSDKVNIVSKNYVEVTEQIYYNIADIHLFLAEKYIFLLAGEDCDGADDCGPCIGPVLVLTPKGITYSDRVFATASPNAQCAVIFHMWPFINCEPFEGCGSA